MSRSWFRSSAAAALALALVPAFPAHAQLLREDFWVPNAFVEDLAIVGDAVYLGGSFTQVGPATGAFVGLDAATGSALQPFPQVAAFSGASVRSAVSDGADGWYIGGLFSSVRGQPRTNLAHLDSAGNVTSWNPGASGYVFALARDATTGVVYAGGNFSMVGGQTRYSLAAIDSNGAVTAFDASFAPGAGVNALTLYGGLLYAVGAFSSVAGETRNCAAAFNSTTGGLGSWAPDIDGPVFCMGLRETATSTQIYFGGTFTHVSGIGRVRLAMVDGTTGGVGSWNPGADAPVLAMAVTGGTSIFNPLRVYVGGGFQLIATTPRSRLALINESGVVQAWNPGASDWVRVLRTAGALVYAGGDFTSIGGQPFRHLAAIDAAGAATSWDPLVGARVFAIGTTATAVFAGGEFWTANGVRRNRLAALSRTSGMATSWDPGADATVRAITAVADTLYVGGDFTLVGGQARNRLAALEAATGALKSWNPDANGRVRDLAVESGIVYAAGDFNMVGVQPHDYLAAIDAGTGLATAWNPSPNGSMTTVSARGGTVYAGGEFSMIGGQSRSNLAALDAASGMATGWNPFAGPDPLLGFTLIEEIAFSGPYVVVGGYFGRMGGRERTRLAFVDSATALANSWDHYAEYDAVNGLAVEGSTIYVGGGFAYLGGVPRNGLAAIDASTGVLLPYNPTFFAGAGPLVVRDGTVYAGGYFQSAHVSFAVFSGVTVGVDDAVANAGPAALRVAPNPFRSQIALRFSLPRGGDVEVSVHDLAGRLVRRIHRGARPAGEHRMLWDGRDQDGRTQEAGVYLVRVRAESLCLNAKVVHLE